MKQLLSLFICLYSFCCFSQKKEITYESNYLLENKYKASTDDTANAYSFNLAMKASYKVYSNENFALIIAKVEDINIPLELSLMADTSFIDYNKGIMYTYSERTGKRFKISTITNKVDSNKIITNYNCGLNVVQHKTADKILIWSTDKLPWYVNPGLFYSKQTGAIVNISTKKSEIILTKAKPTSFNFKKALNKIKKFKIETKEIDMLEKL
jgi:hypothetical protein